VGLSCLLTVCRGVSCMLQIECGRSYKHLYVNGNTSNILIHIQRHHPDVPITRLINFLVLWMFKYSKGVTNCNTPSNTQVVFLLFYVFWDFQFHIIRDASQFYSLLWSVAFWESVCLVFRQCNTEVFEMFLILIMKTVYQRCQWGNVSSVRSNRTVSVCLLSVQNNRQEH